MALGLNKRWAVAVVVAAVVAGSGLSFVVVRARRATFLVAGSSSWMPGEPTLNQPPVGNEDVVVPAFRYGQRYGYGFSVRNDGPDRLRVEGFPDGGGLLFERTEVRMAPTVDGDVLPERAVRFRPFALKPDQERMIYFFGRFANCSRMGAGTAIEQSAVEVRFKALWFHRTATIPLRPALRIMSPGNTPPACPET